MQVLSLVMLWAWLLPACKARLRPCWRKHDDSLLASDETLLPSQRTELERQAQLQEYMARLMGERLMEHQHRLSTLKLRLTLLNTPRQAGFLRARPATDGPFATYWAELRRDKRIYFFAHTAPSQHHLSHTARPDDPRHANAGAAADIDTPTPFWQLVDR